MDTEKNLVQSHAAQEVQSWDSVSETTALSQRHRFSVRGLEAPVTRGLHGVQPFPEPRAASGPVRCTRAGRAVRRPRLRARTL